MEAHRSGAGPPGRSNVCGWAVIEARCVTYGEIVSTVKAGEPLKAALLGQLRGYAAELGLTRQRPQN